MYALGDAASKTGLAELLAGPGDVACRHPMRRAILALLSSEELGRSPSDLCAALPDSPAWAVVKYHLGVLHGVGLVRRGNYAEPQPIDLQTTTCYRLATSSRSEGQF